jgi:hypothetical protein
MKGKKFFIMLNIDDVEIKMQGACFKGKVMNRYGSWNHGKFTYKCLSANVMDHKGFEFQTITLVILEAFAPHHFDKIHVTKCINVINFNCGAKSKYKHGNNFHVIKVNSSRIEIMEIHFSLFNSCLCITILLHTLYFVKFNMMLFILMLWSCKFMVQ